MDINRISGYIPGKIVFFLMQVQAQGAWVLSHKQGPQGLMHALINGPTES